MIDRDKVIQDAFNGLTEQGLMPTNYNDRRAAASIVYDVVEPVVRADERDRILADPPEGDPSFGWHLEYMKDQMRFAEDIAARLVRVIGEQQERADLLLDALEDVVNQACSDRSEELDSMALSAYAYGLRTLAELGKVKITSEYGRRVIAEWVRD